MRTTLYGLICLLGISAGIAAGYEISIRAYPVSEPKVRMIGATEPGEISVAGIIRSRELRTKTFVLDAVSPFERGRTLPLRISYVSAPEGSGFESLSEFKDGERARVVLQRTAGELVSSSIVGALPYAQD